MAPGRRRFDPSPDILRELYDGLLAAYGAQPWWPADSAFEIMVGAVLTQNAAWANVEKAIDRLKAARLLSLPALLEADHDTLADAIRPSGYFNIKARRLRNLCEFLERQGGLDRFAARELAEQREALLGVNGVGPETADDILLYALDRPVFVIDAYTRRLLQRYRLAHGAETYEELRSGFERALEGDVYLYQQYHALIVIHAKQVCRKAPDCRRCPLVPVCPSGTA
ncbi:MAG: endonuclease III domain-containing protein [Chromatiaceae bacterium]|jgi:endonuclease-3 related protein|nr:endonuclease III domain-containing protein [Chromatiaceae bacterium]